MISATLAVVVAVSLAPAATTSISDGTSPLVSDSTNETVDAATSSASETSPVDGSVGVAVPASGLPEVEPGSIVHAVAVNDPLISGEVRETTIVVREARVLTVDEAAVTIEVREDDALVLVEAMTTGSVVLVSVGGG